MSDRWLLVANPAARSGEAQDRIPAAERALRDHGLEVELLLTRADGRNVERLVERLAAGGLVGVVAMGGDGTFHDVGNALVQSGRALPMGVLPAGTGNNQARSLGLPLGSLAEGAAVIAGSGRARMDGLRVESFSPVGTPRPTVWSFDSIGFGFSARTLLYRFEDKEWLESQPFLRDLYRDQWVYAGAAVRALAASYVEDHAFDARITTPEGTTFYEGLHDLIVNNTRYYAQAWVIDPAGRHDDGLAELVVIRDMDDWAGRALVTLDGNPLREWTEADVGDEVAHVAWCEIELFDRPMEPPIPAQVDGEPVEPCGRVRVDVIQGVLELCVPTTPAG